MKRTSKTKWMCCYPLLSFYSQDGTYNASSFQTDKTTTSIFHKISTQHAATSIQTKVGLNGDEDTVSGDTSSGRGYQMGPVLKALLQKWDSTEGHLVDNTKDNISLTSL